MTTHIKRTLVGTLLSSAALMSMTLPVLSQSLTRCSDPELAECANGQVVEVPVGANTEPDSDPVSNSSGFVLALDGEPVNADPRVEDQVRRVDLALAEADVQVRVDGLELTPRLSVETAGAARAYGPGDTVTLRSETNYPAFIARSEMRIIDRGAAGGPRLVATAPVDANGTVSVTLPDGNDLVVVHRVYDARGRYDETTALPLGRPDDRALSAAEDGADYTAVRNIRVRGGAVTVAADNLAPGSRLHALGGTVPADGQGRAVIQRILPPGDHAVDVDVSGASGPEFTRDVTVPGAEWFTFGVADLTYTRRDVAGETIESTTGRLQFYADGETASGVRITASIDTGEEEIDELFERLDEKDPRSLIESLEDSDSFLTYGDDSESEDNTPTSGKFYLKVERDGNFVLWGDYQADVKGSAYLRNERTLYGAQVHAETQATTEGGKPRASVDLYAAQPDQLAGRDVFEGTGGSVYFLQRQAITAASETITVEIRDVDTGRVIDRRTLVEGRDYRINYTQGVITLTSPLSSTTAGNLIVTNAGGDNTVNLVVQYEYTPTSSDVDGFAYGGRVEVWATDQLRLGVTAVSDDSGTSDYRATSVDLRYEFGENSFVQLDVAQSEGLIFGSSFSNDGGLIVNNSTPVSGEGSAIKIEGQADFADLGFANPGVLGGYYEQREEGFQTLDYSVTAATGDETLYGAYVRGETGNGLSYYVYLDRYENEAGSEKSEIGAEVSANLSPKLKFTAGVEFLDKETPTESGQRTDIGLRLDYAARDDLTLSFFGQTTVDSSGLDERSRYGLGLIKEFNNGWAVEAEVSDGTGGLGARVLASHSDDGNNSTYFGYELDPGRAIDARVSQSDNGGKYVLGGRRQINEDIAIFAENTYDIFGDQRSLTGAYGVTYVASDFLTYDAALEVGDVEDSVNGDFSRYALSLGVRYEDDATTARARLEFRQERASEDSTREDADTIILSLQGRYKINEEQRLVFSLDAADTDTDESSILDGTLVDMRLGYAYRPIDNERLNVLIGYRYLYDMYGQQVDGVAGAGPVQESHVFEIQASYDLSTKWTLGGKLGFRLTESAASAGDPLVSNDAWLAIANARYHMVHNWDVLLELRHFEAQDSGLSETSALGVVYRHVGNNAKIGVGYNFGTFSDDLTDLTLDDKGLLVNLVAKF